jgi:peroxiredoxin
LLSDPERAIAAAYGSLKPIVPGIARSVCLIDRNGTVLYTQAGAPGAAIILESLASE